MRFGGFEYTYTMGAGWSQGLGLVLYALLIVFLIRYSMRGNKTFH